MLKIFHQYPKQQKVNAAKIFSMTKINRQNLTLLRVTRDGSRTIPYGLPDPWGSLLASVLPKLLPKRTSGGPYVKLSSSQHCEIAKYADQHGAAEHFSRKLGKHVSESTVKSIKKAFSNT